MTVRFLPGYSVAVVVDDSATTQRQLPGYDGVAIYQEAAVVGGFVKLVGGGFSLVGSGGAVS